MSIETMLASSSESYNTSGDSSALSSVADFVTLGIPSAAVSAGVSIANTAISLGNAFGLESEEIKTEDTLYNAGLYDSAEYYKENKDAIDAVGFVAGAFVPGLGGIKMFRGIQASATFTSGGRLSTGFVKRALVPDTSIKPMVNAIKDRRESVFTTLNGEKLKLIANGFHQQALEAAAFEGAVLLTMNQNPTIDTEDLGYFDSIASNLGGAGFGVLLGTGIGGTLHAFSSLGKVKRIYKEWHQDNAKLFTRGGEGNLNVPTGDLALMDFQEYARVRDVVPEDLADAAAMTRKAPELKARTDTLKTRLLDLAGGNPQISNKLFQMLETKNVEEASAFLSSIDSAKAWNVRDSIFELPLQDVEHALKDDWADYLYEVVKYSEDGKSLSKGQINKILNRTEGLSFPATDEHIQLAGRGVAFTTESKQWDNLMTWRHEIGYLNTYQLADLMKDSPLGRRLAAQGAELSKLQKPADWALTSDDFIASRPLEDQHELLKLRYFLNTPDELLSNSQAILSNPRFAAEAKKVAPDMYKLLLGNRALSAKYGPTKSILDLHAQELIDGNITPTIADLAGKPRYIKSKLQMEYGRNGNERVNLDQAFDPEKLSPIEANAMYSASKVRTDIVENMEVDWLDLPRLTAAYTQQIPIKLTKDGAPLVNNRDLRSNIFYAKNVVGRKLVAKRTENNKPYYTTSEVARLLDTGEGFVQRTADVANMEPENAFSLIGRKTNEARDIPLWSARPNVDPLEPSYAVLRVSKANTANEGTLNSLADAEIRIKNERVIRDTALAPFLGKEGEALPKATHAQYLEGEVTAANTINPIHSISPLDKTSGQLTAAQMGYLTGGSWAQFVGRTTNRIDKAKYAEADKAFSSSMIKLRADQDAIAEGAVLDSVLRQDKYKFVPADFNEALRDLDPNSIRPEVLEYLDSIGLANQLFKGQNDIWTTRLAGMFNDIVTKSRSPEALEEIVEQFQNAMTANVKTIKNENLGDFWKTKVSFNADQVVGTKRVLSQLRGTASNLDDQILYPGRLNTDRFSHFALVTSNSKGVMAGKDTGMIIAHDAASLQQKISLAKTSMGDSISVHTAADIKMNKELLGEYENQLLFRDNLMDNQLQKNGVAWDVVPEPDPRLFDDYLTDTKRELSGLVRAHVEMKYGEELATLNSYANSVDQYNSTFGKPSKWQGKARNVYEDTRKMLLDISNKDKGGWWETMNTVSDDVISNMAATVKGAFYNAAHKGEWEKMNEVLADYGLDKVYNESSQLLLTSANAPKSIMPNLVGKLNSVIATAMLRLDTAQAVVNTISTPIMLVPEFKAMVKAARADRVQVLRDGTTVTIPGREETLDSLNSILYQGMKEFAKGDKGDLVTKYRDMGLLDGTLQELKRAMELTAELPITEAGKLGQKVDKVVNTLALPTDTSEQFVKFMAAYTADVVGTTLKVPDGMINASINSFVNKVHGNYLASQRPKMFQGWAGQAIGLFQTYQFNLVQGLLRHVEDGNKSSAVAMGLLQGGIFGAQSVPGFQMLNQYVGQRSREDNDFYRTTKSLIGEDAGNWLLYGTASNLTVPLIGQGIDLYSRGDLTPRTPILLPTSAEEVPIISFYGKAIGNILDFYDKVDNGGSLKQSALDLLAHNGMNRPLQGITNLYVGERTTRAGSLLRTYQEIDAWNVLTKAMGTKTLDEAVAVSAFYRTNAYSTYRNQKLKDLGEAFKSTIRAGDYGSEEYKKFGYEYTKLGGNITQFGKWTARQYEGATESQINKLRDNNNSAEGRYLQEVLGGAVEDYRYTPPSSEE